MSEEVEEEEIVVKQLSIYMDFKRVMDRIPGEFTIRYKMQERFDEDGVDIRDLYKMLKKMENAYFYRKRKYREDVCKEQEHKYITFIYDLMSDFVTYDKKVEEILANES